MQLCAVAPFAGAWIEICPVVESLRITFVAPFAGAWIEILSTSRPIVSNSVAPFAGAWIEMIVFLLYPSVSSRVAPFAGAWIEIRKNFASSGIPIPSLPSRERGLKFSTSYTTCSHAESLPSRERGLKSVGL